MKGNAITKTQMRALINLCKDIPDTHKEVRMYAENVPIKVSLKIEGDKNRLITNTRELIDELVRAVFYRETGIMPPSAETLSKLRRAAPGQSKIVDAIREILQSMEGKKQ